MLSGASVRLHRAARRAEAAGPGPCRVDWELWTSTNDGCGNSCDRQATFKVQMRDAAVELSKVLARPSVLPRRHAEDSQACTRVLGRRRCRRCACSYTDPRAYAAPVALAHASQHTALGTLIGRRVRPAERLHDLCAALHAAQVLVRRGPRGVPGQLHQPGALLRGRLHLRQVCQNVQASPGAPRARLAPQGAEPCQELLPRHAFSACAIPDHAHG